MHILITMIILLFCTFFNSLERCYAGHMAATSETVNIVDYQDNRFNPAVNTKSAYQTMNPAVDTKSVYQTMSILCGPIQEPRTSFTRGGVQGGSGLSRKSVSLRTSRMTSHGFAVGDDALLNRKRSR